MEMSQATSPRPIRGPHGGWQKQEIDALQRSIDEANASGQSLRSVFERMGRELGRKPNSIRNFYYAQVRSHEEGAPARALPFETFTQDEVERLIEDVLTARAQGMSVRACVRSLAGGDRTRMLRYQNKYRSTIRTRPELVSRVMKRLSDEGRPFVSPYTPESDEQPEQTLARMRKRAEQAGDPQLTALFASLDHLLDLALEPRSRADEGSEADVAGNAIGAADAPHPELAPVIPADSEALRRADRLSAQCDVLRIHLADEQERGAQLRSEATGMVTLLKEYIALPETDRITHCGAFCQQAAARLSAVECALMQQQTVPAPIAEKVME